MLIPFDGSYGPDQDLKYKWKVQDSLKKAKHLSERINLFINDIEKGKFKDSDRKKIKTMLKESLNKTIELL